MNKYTFGEVQEVIKELRCISLQGTCDIEAEMLTEYAERIKADEGSVPVAKIRHFHYSGIARNGFSQEAQMLDGTPELLEWTELFTHPPAQTTKLEGGIRLSAPAWPGQMEGKAPPDGWVSIGSTIAPPAQPTRLEDAVREVQWPSDDAMRIVANKCANDESAWAAWLKLHAALQSAAPQPKVQP